MIALITLGKNEIGQGTVQTVNARDLHLFLEVGKDFSNWIKDRVKKYGFVENQDFVVFANSGENPEGGRPAIDYHLTIDMAKELSMVERNGYQSRVQQGLVDHKIHTFTTSDGQERITEQVFITAKGMAKLAQMFATPKAAAENWAHL